MNVGSTFIQRGHTFKGSAMLSISVLPFPFVIHKWSGQSLLKMRLGVPTSWLPILLLWPWISKVECAHLRGMLVNTLRCGNNFCNFYTFSINKKKKSTPINMDCAWHLHIVSTFDVQCHMRYELVFFNFQHLVTYCDPKKGFMDFLKNIIFTKLNFTKWTIGLKRLLFKKLVEFLSWLSG